MFKINRTHNKFNSNLFRISNSSSTHSIRDRLKSKSIYDNISSLNNRIKNNPYVHIKKQNNEYENNINLSKLPKIPEYKPIDNVEKQENEKEIKNDIKQNKIQSTIQKKQQNDINELTSQYISKLPTKQIQNQEDMAKVFNSIMNDTPLNSLQSQNKINKKEFNNIKNITEQELAIKINEIIPIIQQKIFNDKNINYRPVIETIYNLGYKFKTNKMYKSIIHSAISRYSRTQLFKIPEDKIDQIIDCVVAVLS